MNYLTYLKINQKILLLIFVVSLLSTVAYTARSYRVERQTILDGINRELQVAAYSVNIVAGPDYQDRVKDAHSIPSKEAWDCLYRLSDAAQHYHALYLYSMVKIDNKIRVTCTSATPQELKKGTWNGYFEDYTWGAPLALRQTFADGKTRFQDYTDKKGSYRSVFVALQTRSGRRYVLDADITTDFISARLSKTLLHSLGIGVAIFAAVFCLGWLLVNKISGPIIRLAVYTRELVSDSFQPSPETDRGLEQISATSHDEVGNLAESFLFMEHELQDYIVKIKETTAAKEQMESELRVGRAIQMSVLPQTFPPYPDRHEFDIYAHIEPAKVMSGDFYDFYMIDEDHLYFTVGDVSGKGVPASLLMVTCRTLLEAMANESSAPEHILSRVNTELARKNESTMFVTVFYAILDVRTGELKYANAGHNPPYVLHGDGRVAELVGTPELAMGLAEEYAYPPNSLVLAPGDCFFLFTDGVTEAMDNRLDMYTEERLKALLETGVRAPVMELVNKVVAEVAAFVGTAPQSDDITMLALRYRGGRAKH